MDGYVNEGRSGEWIAGGVARRDQSPCRITIPSALFVFKDNICRGGEFADNVHGVVMLNEQTRFTVKAEALNFAVRGNVVREGRFKTAGFGLHPINIFTHEQRGQGEIIPEGVIGKIGHVEIVPAEQASESAGKNMACVFAFIDDFGSASSWNLSHSTFNGGIAVEF